MACQKSRKVRWFTKNHIPFLQNDDPLRPGEYKEVLRLDNVVQSGIGNGFRFSGCHSIRCKPHPRRWCVIEMHQQLMGGPVKAGGTFPAAP